MAKLTGRERRKLRIRSKISGTSERPRLSVFRTGRHIYAQVVVDDDGKTLAAASTLSRDLKTTLAEDNKTDSAKKVGALIAKICLEKKIEQVVFDRNGYLYHGRIKALADADMTGLVADHHQRAKAEAATALHDLRHAVDVDDALFELFFVDIFDRHLAVLRT